MVMRINVPIEERGTELLHADPTLDLQAATKHYVDTSIAAAIASSGVSSVNTRTGAVTLTSTDITAALTFTPLDNTSTLDGGTF